MCQAEFIKPLLHRDNLFPSFYQTQGSIDALGDAPGMRMAVCASWIQLTTDALVVCWRWANQAKAAGIQLITINGGFDYK